MANITYPHVEISTKALQNRQVAVAESTATTLLAPFMSKKGPTNQLVAIDSMAEFINTYGELDYTKPNQRQILNIGKWLGSGGRVYACRLAKVDAVNEVSLRTGDVVYDETAGTCTITGSWYSNGVAVANSSDKNIVCKMENTGSEIGMCIYVSELDASAAIKTYTNDELIKFLNVTSVTSVAEAKIAFASIKLGYNSDNKSIKVYTDYKSDYISVPSFSAPVVADSTDLAKCATYSATVGSGLNVSCNAKYEGTYYNDITVTISSKGFSQNTSTGSWYLYLNLTVSITENGKKTELERFRNVSFEKLYQVEESSSYITDISFVKDATEYITTDELHTALDDAERNGLATTFSLVSNNGGSDGNTDIESILSTSLKKILANPLETPFDVMIDCGYSQAVKTDLIHLFCAVKDETDTSDLEIVSRSDAFLYITPYVISGNGLSKPDLEIASDILRAESWSEGSLDLFNMGIQGQYNKVVDIYSKSAGREVYVPYTYQIAGFVPSNDAMNGPQYPVAGLTRAVIKDAVWTNEFPSSKEKQDLYDNHVNYVERDSRGIYIMSQLTATSDDTALENINCSRALLKIKKNMRLLGRQYLHEFNDRLTKQNLLNTLNSYLSNWIQNKTLSYGAVELIDSSEDPTLADDQLKINLNIKFTKTIDVISVDIVVE